MGAAPTDKGRFPVPSHPVVFPVLVVGSHAARRLFLVCISSSLSRSAVHIPCIFLGPPGRSWWVDGQPSALFSREMKDVIFPDNSPFPQGACVLTGTHYHVSIVFQTMKRWSSWKERNEMHLSRPENGRIGESPWGPGHVEKGAVMERDSQLNKEDGTLKRWQKAGFEQDWGIHTAFPDPVQECLTPLPSSFFLKNSEGWDYMGLMCSFSRPNFPDS